MATLRSFGLPFLALVFGACAMPDEPSTADADQALAITDCPEEYCGANSPKVDAIGFHELHIGGLANPQGMRIAGAYLRGTRGSIYVNRGRLIAEINGARITGLGLVGLALRLVNGDKSTTLEIVAVRDLPFPIPQGTLDIAETYVIEYIAADGTRKNLCGARNLPDPVAGEAYGQSPREALLFEGDRIDTATMTIDPTIDRAWFNIGCAGHTLSKLHLTRHTSASGGLAFGRTWKDNQAVLKLLVADYCGTGRPFTIAGQPLAWHDPAKLVTPFPVPTTLDARWDETGATCLSEPRMVSPATEEGAKLFPDIRAQIAAECARVRRRLLSCTDTDFENFDGALRVSVNRQH